MVRVKPFAAIRPPREMAAEVSAPPYDVVNSAEAAALAGPRSLLHITRPEIDFTPLAGEHEQRSYDRAVHNFALWKRNGWLVQDSKPCYYLYAQTMGSHTQYGFVLCAHIEDYENGSIKRHELTRKDKEDDRMVHISLQNANLEPVFFSSGWNIFHGVCYFYPAMLLVYLIKKLYEVLPQSARDFTKKCGKYSYEIFLWQMFVFSFVMPVLIKVEMILDVSKTYHIIGLLNIIVSTVISTCLPLLYYKYTTK